MSETEAATGPAPLAPPLNLPVGSVRALITLTVLATVWAQIISGQQITDALRDTTLLVLGYYFGARSQKAAAADALATPGSREDNPNDPLYLPRGAIRLLIVVGFAAVAWKLHERNTLLAAPPPILVLVGTFLAGAIAKGAVARAGAFAVGRFASWVGHGVAAVTLAIVGAFCGVEALHVQAAAPTWLTPTFLGVVGFYLGKR